MSSDLFVEGAVAALESFRLTMEENREQIKASPIGAFDEILRLLRDTAAAVDQLPRRELGGVS